MTRQVSLSSALHAGMATLYCVCLAYAAGLLHRLPLWPFTLASGQHPIEPVLLAMLLGMLLRQSGWVTATWQPHLGLITKCALYMAIVMLGARLNWHAVWSLPHATLLVIVLVVGITVPLVLWLARCCRCNGALSWQLAVGTAICGTAAIAAVSPLLASSEEDVAISISAINLLGTVAIFVFPLLGHLFGMVGSHYAVWVGCSVQAVPQTVAAAFAYGNASGILGTLVKLARVLLLAPLLLVVGLCNKTTAQAISSNGAGFKDSGLKNNLAHSTAGVPQARLRFTTLLPPFILGFVLMMGLNSMGWLQPWVWHGYVLPVQSVMQRSSDFLLGLALAAIGLRTSLGSMWQRGGKAIAVAAMGAVLIAVLSFLAIKVWL